MVVITMFRVIQWELRKFQVEAETAYESDTPEVMSGQYLWGTLQAHKAMDYLLRNQFFQNTEVDPHTTIYLFDHRAHGWKSHN